MKRYSPGSMQLYNLRAMRTGVSGRYGATNTADAAGLNWLNVRYMTSGIDHDQACRHAHYGRKSFLYTAFWHWPVGTGGEIGFRGAGVSLRRAST